MLSPGSGNTVIKSKLISRRMFLITAAKAVVMVGLVEDLYLFKLIKLLNISLYLIKIDLEMEVGT